MDEPSSCDNNVDLPVYYSMVDCAYTELLALHCPNAITKAIEAGEPDPSVRTFYTMMIFMMSWVCRSLLLNRRSASVNVLQRCGSTSDKNG